MQHPSPLGIASSFTVLTFDYALGAAVTVAIPLRIPGSLLASASWTARRRWTR